MKGFDDMVRGDWGGRVGAEAGLSGLYMVALLVPPGPMKKMCALKDRQGASGAEWAEVHGGRVTAVGLKDCDCGTQLGSLNDGDFGVLTAVVDRLTKARTGLQAFARGKGRPGKGTAEAAVLRDVMEKLVATMAKCG